MSEVIETTSTSTPTSSRQWIGHQRRQLTIDDKRELFHICNLNCDRYQARLKGSTWRSAERARSQFWNIVQVQFGEYLGFEYKTVRDTVVREVGLRRERIQQSLVESGKILEHNNFTEELDIFLNHVNDVEVAEGTSRLSIEELREARKLAARKRQSLEQTYRQSHLISTEIHGVAGESQIPDTSSMTLEERIAWCNRWTESNNAQDLIGDGEQLGDDATEEDVSKLEEEIKKVVQFWSEADNNGSIRAISVAASSLSLPSTPTPSLPSSKKRKLGELNRGAPAMSDIVGEQMVAVAARGVAAIERIAAINDIIDRSKAFDERLASLEGKVGGLDNKLDRLLAMLSSGQVMFASQAGASPTWTGNA